ncbi:MAG: class IV aminotransferase [Sphingomonas hengshuiensis]|nr:MAG: class IV aminotransferase [Sphingomonas hengshuiensis]
MAPVEPVMHGASAAWIDGRAPTAAEWRALAQHNYGHFTSMQVRGHAVQGLDLHLARLREGNRELFDAGFDADAARAAMRDAVRHAGGECALRVTAFAPDFDPRRPDRPLVPVLLVSTAPPSSLPVSPLRVCSTVFSRPLPQVKHIDTFPLFHARRVAMQVGFDDALFVDADGRIGEGSTWNIGFWDGQSVVWPGAPALRGTAEALLCGGLDALGIARQVREVRLADLSRFRAAFACNATGVQVIRGVDIWDFGGDPTLLPMLVQARGQSSWLPI